MRFQYLFAVLAVFCLSTFAHADASYYEEDFQEEYVEENGEDFLEEEFLDEDRRFDYDNCRQRRCEERRHKCRRDCRHSSHRRPRVQEFYCPPGFCGAQHLPPPFVGPGYRPVPMPRHYIKECDVIGHPGNWTLYLQGNTPLMHGRGMRQLQQAEQYYLYQARVCTQITRRW